MPLAMLDRPLLVTLGDPAGIGPELVVRAYQARQLDQVCVVGHPDVVKRGLQACGIAEIPRQTLENLDLWDGAYPEHLKIWNPIWDERTEGDFSIAKDVDWSTIAWGQPDARCAAEAVRCIDAAVRAIRHGQSSGLITAPIHKEALAMAGIEFPGHTEMLQAWSAPKPLPVRMMLANSELRVVLVTIHMALRRAIDAIDHDNVLETIRIAHECAWQWGQTQPRIAVAGLNPHAGEGGLFGDEEVRLIAPAIAQARQQGIHVSGPYAPDTVFMRARHTPQKAGEFDVVVAMTHDHGLIPVKYLGVDQGVNVTLGLPFIRTSPDHGTAFDIAGQGKANPGSFLQALQWAQSCCSLIR
jgi:4-hydroxythreonine-4-phosphate dehydrogenase